MSELSDEAQRLAKKGRRIRDRRQLGKPARSFDARPNDTIAMNALADRSIGAHGLHSLLAGMVFLVGIPVALAVCLKLHTVWSTLIGGLIAGVFMLVAWLVSQALRSVQCRREVAWMRALPFAIDVQSYCRLLGTEALRMTLVLKMSFAVEVASEQQSFLTDMVLGCSRHAHATWSGGHTLVITSPSLSTFHFYQRGTPGTGHDNTRVHAWFRRMVRRCPLVIHSIAPCTRVDVDVSER